MSNKQERITTILTGKFTPKDYILAGGHSGVAYLLDSRTGESIKKIKGNQYFYGMGYLPPTNFFTKPLVVINTGKGVRIWNPVTGKVVWEFKTQISQIQRHFAVISPFLIALAERGHPINIGKIEILNIRTKEKVGNPLFTNEIVSSILPLKNTNNLVVGLINGDLMIINYKTGKTIMTFNTDAISKLDRKRKDIYDIIPLEGDRILVISGIMGTFSTKTGELLSTIHLGGYHQVFNLGILPAGSNKLLVVDRFGGGNFGNDEEIGKVQLILVADDGRLGVLDQMSFQYPHVTVLPENKFVVASSSSAGDNKIFIIQVVNNKFKVIKKLKKNAIDLLYVSPFPLDMRILKCLLQLKLKNYLPKVLVNETFSFF